MYMMTVPSKCPMCGSMVEMLSFWKQVNNFYFHICATCLEKPKTERDLLLLAYRIGHTDGVRQCVNKLSEIK